MGRSHRSRPAGPAAAAGLAAVILAVAGCSAASHPGSPVAAAPGVLSGSITIGSYQPLTGHGAAGVSETAPASEAYFRYVNAHGGIYHRKIVYRYVNDHSRRAMAAPIVHELVQQDNVLAIFNGYGTAAHASVAPFLAAVRVPDVLAGSGCPCQDSPAASPQAFGWRLDYLREGKILGAFVARHFKGRRTGLVYSKDEPGRDGARGLGYEIPRRQVVAKERYRPAGVPAISQAAALKRHGAQVVVAFTSPAATAALRAAMARLHYHPRLVAASSGSDPATLAALLAKTTGGKAAISPGSLTEGIITDSALPSPSSANSWITLFRKIHNQYIPRLPFDTYLVDGMAAAYTLTQALVRAGPNPTRERLVTALNGGLQQGPAVAGLGYSPASHAGATGAYVAVIRGGTIIPLGPVMTTDDTRSGPVTPATATQRPAPASGLPPH